MVLNVLFGNSSAAVGSNADRGTSFGPLAEVTSRFFLLACLPAKFNLKCILTPGYWDQHLCMSSMFSVRTRPLPFAITANGAAAVDVLLDKSLGVL